MFDIIDSEHNFLFRTERESVAWLYVARNPGAYYYRCDPAALAADDSLPVLARQLSYS